MPWYAIKTIGRETRAMLYLRRAGVRAFWPETHKYFRDRRTGKEMHRVVGTFPGYAFICPANDAEYSRARSAIGVGYVLGGYSGERFAPKEIPARWLDDIERAGPIVIGRAIDLKRGDQVKIAAGRIAELKGEIEKLDKAGRARLRVEMFGKEHVVSVPAERLVLATDE